MVQFVTLGAPIFTIMNLLKDLAKVPFGKWVYDKNMIGHCFNQIVFLFSASDETYRS